MIKLGNFFFRYRNLLFVFLYILLFIPSPELLPKAMMGTSYWVWTLVAGLLITVFGQLIRGATIGLAYIIRGGKDGHVYAEDLVTSGIFNHCRNPLYAGNILMLAGVGVLSNSLVFVVIVMPVFILIYHSIVLAEEHYLMSKFGDTFGAYCKKVNRWIPDIQDISSTFSSMHFNWKRWLLKEYNTIYVWLTGITLILVFRYPQLIDHDMQRRNMLLVILLPILLAMYLYVRFLKKSGKLKE